MATLRSRQHHPAGGFQFELPQVRYRSPSYASFDVIVNEVYALINSNPALADKYGWPVERESIANWVDRENAERCQRYGWKEFVYEDTPEPMGDDKVPMDKWPVWAQAVAALKADGDIGVGDTIERTIGPANSDALKKWYFRTFGRLCGCDGRKADYNRRYRY